MSVRHKLTQQNKQVIKKILLNILVIFLGACFLTWFFQYRFFVNNAGSAFNFMFERPKVFLYNAVIISTIIIFLNMILRKPFLSISIVWGLIIIITYIHINKYVARGTPLLPEDFLLADQAGSLAKFIDFGALTRMIISVILVISLGVILDLKTKKTLRLTLPESLPWWLKRLAIPRAAIMVMMVAAFLSLTSFVRNHAGIAYERVEWLNTTLTAWNQDRNYSQNGFILGFLYNLNKVQLDEPEGYSENTIAKITKKYEAKKKADTNRKSLKDADYNIVVILDESFYDPELMRQFYTFSDKKDITPNWHKIAKEYPSGYMYSTDYGGGTANVEFEVFTGLSNNWANTVPYTDIFPRLGSVDSVASWAKKSGYKATAIHPYNGGMYKRDLALKVEGYDDFIDISRFEFTEHDGNSQYINDRSSYDQTLKVLRNNKNKQMIELVTMQNHLPYEYATYDSHEFEADEEDWEAKEHIESYLETLHRSDKYLGDFISELDKLDEKTVVLFFGDHSPGIFTKSSSAEADADRNVAQLTPYFIYSNFEFTPNEVPYKGTTKELPKIVGSQKLPTTTPNCLANTLYNVMGLEKPVLGYLLDDVCSDAPILTSRYLNGKEVKAESVKEYEKVVYDVLGGQRYYKEN